MTGIRASAALLVLLLALTGCVPEHAFVEALSDPWVREQATLDSLSATGQLPSALALARRRMRAARAGLEPAWRLASARVTLRDLERRGTMAAADRTALERADAAVLAGRAAFAADSLAGMVECYREALQLRIRVLGPDDPATADAAFHLANANFFVGRVREADSLVHAARAVFLVTYGPGHPRIADAEEVIGRLVKNYSGSDAFIQALAYDSRSLRIRVASEGPHSLAVASSLHLLGNLHRAAHRPAVAIAFFQSSLEIRLRMLGPVHEDVASAYGGLAFLATSRGQWAQAATLAERALAAAPDPNRFSVSRNTRMGLRGQMLRRMGRTVEAVAALREAVAMSESLWQLTARDEASTVASGLNMHAELALALAELGRSDEAFDQLERGTSRTLLARLLVADSAMADPWRGLRARSQRWLADDEAIVIWPRSSVPYMSDFPLWACVVRRTGPVQWVRLDRRTPLFKGGRSIREVLWGELRAASEWPRRVTEVEPFREKALWMYRERFAPLEPALAGVRRLFVCSPDFHCGGPLGVLRDEQGRWLADRYVISYAPSVLLWTIEHERIEHTGGPARSGALLVGDPAYPPRDPGRWSRLRGAGEEIQQIAARLGDATLLTGTDASAARLRALASSGRLQHYALLHFATHTAIDSKHVMESALVLAPDQPGDALSSRLSAREVLASWKLGADLVCLAGCQTVRGVGSATEGSLGLQQAFLAAGARSLLVSLWPVDDHATSLLMDTFYRRIAASGVRVDRAAALAEAQREVRESRDANGRQPYAHPAYWAEFVLVGDPN